MVVPTDKPIRAQDWKVDPDDRRTFYGATDIAQIMGVSAYGGPIDVYRHKREGKAKDPTTAMRWGLLLEDAICDGYAELRGVQLRRVRQVEVPGIPFVLFHPDRLVVGQPGLMDAKATNSWSDHYGEPGTDQVPPWVRVQMVCYTGATKRAWADVAVLSGATEGLDLFTVPAFPDLYEASLEAAVEFHERHVLAGIPPDPDGSPAWAAFAADRWPQDDGTTLPPPTPAQALAIEELRQAVLEVQAAERRRDQIIQQLQAAMGDASTWPTSFGKISWKRQAPSTRWKEVASGLAARIDAAHAQAILDAAVQADKAGREGPRVFRHPFRSDKEGKD